MKNHPEKQKFEKCENIKPHYNASLICKFCKCLHIFEGLKFVWKIVERPGWRTHKSHNHSKLMSTVFLRVLTFGSFLFNCWMWYALRDVE